MGLKKHNQNKVRPLQIRSSFPFTQRFATTLLLTLPLAGALASNSLEPKDTKPYFSAKILPTCVSFSLALIGVLLDVHWHLQVWNWDNVCSAFKDLFGATVLDFICWAESCQNAENGFCLIGQRQHLCALWRTALALLMKALCLSLRQSSPFPYRCCSGRRRPHSYTVLNHCW